MNYHLTPVSNNVKTGPMPVSTSSPLTCPSTCPLKAQGCYAKAGSLAYHWRKVTNGASGTDYNGFLAKVKALYPTQLWRHNQAGDLAGRGTIINKPMLEALVKANEGKRGFTYTHKPVENHKHAHANKQAIADANTKGFTVNLSADSIDQADRYKALNIAPVVVTVPIGTPRKLDTPSGNRVIQCPAQYKNNVTCMSCKLCAIRDRKVIIGFEAHGYAKRKVSNRILKGE